LSAAPDPRDADAWFALGRDHGMAQRHAEAEAAFRKVVALKPEMREARINLGMALVYQGRHREAIPVLLEARVPGDRSLNDILMYCILSALQGGTEAKGLPVSGLAPLDPDAPVSVVIPTSNRPVMLGDALASLADQTYGNWEVVVVNDGGDDLHLPVAVAGRATYIRLEQRGGAARARNVALRAARGAVIAFLDDDDVFLPRHLECLVAGLRASGAAFAYTKSVPVEERVTDGVREEIRRGFAYDYRYSRELLLVRSLMPPTTWGARREAFERCGGFDEGLAWTEDWDMLLRLSALGPFHQIREATAEIRVRPGVADSTTRRIPLAPWCEEIYRRYPSGGDALIELGRSIYLESFAA
jgi:O-antigen biosynthesis protein